MRSAIYRTLLSIAVVATLGACAQGAAARSDVGDLRQELYAQRQLVRQLSERVERLEDQADARERARSDDGVAVPKLAVVKLRPKTNPAPGLDTRVAVVEPPPKVVEELSEVPEVDPALLDVEYEDAVKALHTGNVEGGVRRLSAFAAAYPRHARADNAVYYVGAARLVQGDLDAAAQAFSRVLEGFPASDSVADALLGLAKCRLRAQRRKEAKALYAQLISQYPGTSAAKEASVQLAEMAP